MENTKHKKLLNLLRINSSMTKPELGAALSLSHTSINAFIEHLTAAGLVETSGIAASGGGRKPLVYKLSENARHFFGVNVSPAGVQITLINLLGEEIERSFIAHAGGDFDALLAQTKSEICEIIFRRRIRKSVLGVGMTFPGIVNAQDRLVQYAPNIGIRDYSLAQFEQELDIPLYLENEAVAAARSELFGGRGTGCKNFVYVSVAEGIGTGIVIGGEIYRGTRRNAGEFGHIKVSDAGLRCKCGRCDCWELYASKSALLRYCDESGMNLVKDDGAALSALHTAFLQGDSKALAVLERYTRYLFRGLQTILLSLSPDEIVLGGDMMPILGDAVSFGLDRLSLGSKFYGYESVPIRVASGTESGAVLGSARLPLYELFSPIDTI